MWSAKDKPGNLLNEPHACCWRAKRYSQGLFNKPTCWRHELQSAGPLNNNQNQSRNVHLLWANQREKEREERGMGCSIFTQWGLGVSHFHERWWFLIITALEAKHRGWYEEKGHKCWRIRGGRDQKNDREITLQGEMEDKRGKRWSGRMEEQGPFWAAALLNSSAGVQRGCVCVYGE